MSSNEEKEAVEKEEVDSREDQNEVEDKPTDKITTLTRELKQERERVEETLSKMKYLQADFDNYQKRMNREVEQLLRIGSERMILKLLGILDDFERAIDANKNESGNTGVFDGILMIRDEIKVLLKGEGIEEIESVGKKFDPMFHEAISYKERSDVEDGNIISEIRKGYRLQEKVIRTSMVEVARKVRIVDANESGTPVD